MDECRYVTNFGRAHPEEKTIKGSRRKPKKIETNLCFHHYHSLSSHVKDVCDYHAHSSLRRMCCGKSGLGFSLHKVLLATQFVQ